MVVGIAWILWASFFTSNNTEIWMPQEGYATVEACRASQVSREVPPSKENKNDRSFHCFPHTFDPRPRNGQ